MRIYLDVDIKDYDKVDDLGAKWDEGFDRWYVDAWVLPKDFMPWAPDNYDLMMDARFSAHQLTPYEEKFLQDHPYQEESYDEEE